MNRELEEGIAASSVGEDPFEMTPIQVEQRLKQIFIGEELDKHLLGMKLCLSSAREVQAFKKNYSKLSTRPVSQISMDIRVAKRSYMQFLKDLKEGKYEHIKEEESSCEEVRDAEFG